MSDKPERRYREGSVYLRGSTWWVQYYRNGKPYRESSHSDSEAKARKLLTRRMGEIAVGKFIEPKAERVTLKSLLDDLLTDYRINAKKSHGRVQDSVDHLTSYFHDDRALTVTTDRIRAYIAYRQDEKAANATINRELAALKRAFNLGLQAQKLIARPYVPHLEENNVRRGFFEHGDFIKVRDKLPEHLRPLVTFLYYTGCRSSEARSLEWRQVDFGAGMIRLDPGTTKNKQGRLLALDGELLDVMRDQWERRKVAGIPGHAPALLCPFVFHRGGKRIGDFRKAWMTACKAVGIGTFEKRDNGRVEFSPRPHDFRRTAVRNMVRAGVPERVGMMVSGHKTRSVFDRYNIVSEDDLREAARKTSEHIERQSKAASVAVMAAGSVTP